MFHFSLCMELGSCPGRHTKRERGGERSREGRERKKGMGGGGVVSVWGGGAEEVGREGGH